MIQDHSREKLINAIIFFATSTNFCGKTKLYKLLYFLDFTHFMEVGRSVTGLEYFAWPKGPVPVQLQDEFNNPPNDMTAAIEVSIKKTWQGHEMLEMIPHHKFDASHFSKRELQLLEELAKEFRNNYAKDMVEATHLENLPWHEIYEVKGRKQKLIPYELAARKQEAETIAGVAAEHEEFIRNYE